jgi:transcriptional regulator with XRE-family HTH domain
MAQTNREIAKSLAADLRAYRLSRRMTQRQLAERSGVGLTPLKRFEATGGITLNNLIAILRGLGLLNRITELVPEPISPSPLERLHSRASGAPPPARTLR